MSCTAACLHPTPAQAHCGACHHTFGGVSGFDAHRRDGQCAHPDTIGLANKAGVWRREMSQADQHRLRGLT